MTILFSFIVIASLILGFVYGWINQFSGFQLLIPIIVSGFLGSCVVAILFTYLYFTHVETDKERIKRLKDEIPYLKKRDPYKMTIQWFPGHMVETENLLKKAISKVDAVLEILDARLPQASANPFVNKICTGKFRLKVLNKADLADPEQTKLWLDYFETQKNNPAIAICATQKSHTTEVLNYCVNKIDRNRARKLKIMVLGIPNTGKSTILNSLAGKKIAKTGNVPAITRQQQRTSLNNNIDIYDTPGILWPVIEPKQRAYILAASGAISDTAIDYTDIAFFAASLLIQRYPDLLMVRYPFLETLPTDGLMLIEKIGSARGYLKKGGIVNLQKASEVLIRELRSGKIGKISFETPKDIEDNEPHND